MKEVPQLNDPNTADKKFQKELNAGIVSLVLLNVLGRANEPTYGYQIAREIETVRENLPIMKQGAFYPVLRSLENSGLLESTVEPSVSGPPRRYYRITKAGSEALQRWTAIWQEIRNFVDSILKGT
jgi:PadR family transcriptional regulator PadR